MPYVDTRDARPSRLTLQDAMNSSGGERGDIDPSVGEDVFVFATKGVDIRKSLKMYLQIPKALRLGGKSIRVRLYAGFAWPKLSVTYKAVMWDLLKKASTSGVSAEISSTVIPTLSPLGFLGREMRGSNRRRPSGCI